MTDVTAWPGSLATIGRESLDQAHLDYLAMSSSSVAELVERLAVDHDLAGRAVTVDVSGDGVGPLASLSARDVASLDVTGHGIVLEAAECDGATVLSDSVRIAGTVRVCDSYDLAVAYALALAAGAGGDGADRAMGRTLATMLGDDADSPATFDGRALRECMGTVARATRRMRVEDPTDAAVARLHGDVRAELAAWASGDGTAPARGRHLRRAGRRTAGPSQDLVEMAGRVMPDVPWPGPALHALGALDALWAASCVRYGLRDR